MGSKMAILILAILLFITSGMAARDLKEDDLVKETNQVGAGWGYFGGGRLPPRFDGYGFRRFPRYGYPVGFPRQFPGWPGYPFGIPRPGFTGGGGFYGVGGGGIQGSGQGGSP